MRAVLNLTRAVVRKDYAGMAGQMVLMEREAAKAVAAAASTSLASAPHTSGISLSIPFSVVCAVSPLHAWTMDRAAREFSTTAMPRSSASVRELARRIRACGTGCDRKSKGADEEEDVAAGATDAVHCLAKNVLQWKVVELEQLSSSSNSSSSTSSSSLVVDLPFQTHRSWLEQVCEVEQRGTSSTNNLAQENGSEGEGKAAALNAKMDLRFTLRLPGLPGAGDALSVERLRRLLSVARWKRRVQGAGIGADAQARTTAADAAGEACTEQVGWKVPRVVRLVQKYLYWNISLTQ